MTAATRRVLIASAVLFPSLLAAPAFADEHGRLRVQEELRGGVVEFDMRSLFAAPLPSGPGISDRNGSRAVNAYAPEQHVRLKQTIFTGGQ